MIQASKAKFSLIAYNDCTDDIPSELLENFFGHIHFVEDDFWCNLDPENKDRQHPLLFVPD